MSRFAVRSSDRLTHERRLRQADDVRLRRYGWAAVATVLLPLGSGAEGGLYPWELFGIADGSRLLGALAPQLLGLCFIALSYAPMLSRLGQSLLALGALWLALLRLTASPQELEAAFEGLLAFVGRRPLLVTAGLGLIAAGAELRLDEGTSAARDLPWRVARALLVAGCALTVLVYVLPQRGTPLGVLLVEQIGATLWHGSARAAAGRVLFWLLGLAPLVAAIGAALAAARPGQRAGIGLGLWARYGVSLLGVLLTIPLLATERDPHRALLQIRAAILLAVAIGVSARAVQAIARQLLEAPLPPTPPASTLARDVRLRQLLERYQARPTPERSSLLELPEATASHPWLRWLVRRRLATVAAELPEPPADPLRPSPSQLKRYRAALDGRFDRVRGATPSSTPEDSATPALPATARLALWTLTGRTRLPAAMALATLAAVGLLGAWLYEPAPDLGWAIGPPSPTADRLFGRTLPRYVVLLARRSDQSGPSGAGTEAAASARRKAIELEAEARRVDAELANRIARVVAAAEARDRTGLIWLDAIHGVNHRLRELGLPYYLDGNVLQLRSRRDDSTRRLYYVTSYRVERIRRFAAAGRAVAALHVRRLDRLNVEGARLGAVRTDEPFALVMLDAVERSVARRVEALSEQGSCRLPADRWSTASLAAQIDQLCAQTLLRLAADRGLDLQEPTDDVRRMLTELQIDATERHELQHQVDGPALVVPGALYRALPRTDEATLRSTARELSAHLAELGTEDSLAAAWRLADLTTHLVRPRTRSPYRHAAALIASHLLGRPVLPGRGRVALEQVLTLWQQAAERGPGLARWVAPAARRAHRELFGTPVAALVAHDGPAH